MKPHIRKRRRPTVAYPLVPVSLFMPVDSIAAACSGIYALLDDEDVLYVGQSCCVSERIAEHLRSGHLFDQAVFLKAPLWVLEDLEVAYIRMLRPRWNVSNNVVDEVDLEEAAAVVST